MVDATAGRTDPMRVLFLSDHLGYAGGVTHGATTYFTNVLPQLNNADDIDLTVCFLRDRHPAVHLLEAQGVEPLFLNRSKWDPYAVVELISLIRERDIHIVHAAGMKGILLGRAAARLTNRRAVIHLHDTWRPGRLLASLHRAMASWQDVAIVVSQAVGDLAAQSLGIDRTCIVTLHNPLDVSRYEQPQARQTKCVRIELGIAHDAPVIAVVARLSAEKGHAAMIRSLPRIAASMPTATLLIVGDGPVRSACESLVQQMNLESRVRFLGNRSDVPEILAAVDVLAIPSSREGFTYSALEAMAAGTPVVAFAVGGLVELFHHKQTGLLVPPGDETALADTIVRVLSDRAMAARIAAQARSSVQRFAIEPHVNELRRHYRRILKPLHHAVATEPWLERSPS